MGASESAPEDTFALPQQHIVTVIDGQVNPAQSSAAGSVGRVGTSKGAVAVKPPFTLSRGGVRLHVSGHVTVEVNATVHGTVKVLVPALERAGASTWPTVEVEGQRQPWQRRVLQGECVVLEFDRPDELLDLKYRQEAYVQEADDGSRCWPLVLVLRPGVSDVDSAAPREPPDGTLMACCIVRRGQLLVSRQVIAWGGGGAAYVMKELYGIQGTQNSVGVSSGNDVGDVDNQKNCVVCLTSAKDTALLPCGHFCVCYECGAYLRLSPARNRCPLCRREVNDIVHIDVAPDPDLATAVASANPQGAEVPRLTEVAQPLHDETPRTGVNDTIAMVTHSSVEDVRAARLRRFEAHPPSTSEAAMSADGRLTEGSATARDTPPCELPSRCLQRLTREMKQIEEQRTKYAEEHGVCLELSDSEGSDLRAWSLAILSRGVDKASVLGKELQALNVEAIELEVWIPNGFPLEPPQLRVIRPFFRTGSFFVQQHGALCLEILTKQGWTPAMSLLQLGVHVKTMMSQGNGTVSGTGQMGDPGPAGRERAWATARLIESSHRDWKPFSSD